MHYHPFLNFILSVKSYNLVQVWDTSEIVKAAETYDQSNQEQNKENFVKCDKPFKEICFAIGESEQQATCAAWLPTDSNLFVVGYDSGHLCFFDYRDANLDYAHELPEKNICCVVAHEFS